MKKKTILLVEDEKVQRDVLTLHLEENGYQVHAVETAEAAESVLATVTVDAVITDFNLPDRDGQFVLEQVKAMNPTIPVLFITAFASIDGAVRALQAGAAHYLTKPIHVEELILVLRRAMEQQTLVSENRRMRQLLETSHSLKGIVASSPKMSAVLNLAARVAETKASILLSGESGTGKEVVARAIHLASHRKENPFIAFNVAALSPALIESELFGHEKGAFTGADRQRFGRFEQADGGTLFIDEIGDIPLEVQTKFLRVLQENVIERTGGNQTIPVDIRIIAATHKDLEQMIRTGTFREDLYYRLNVVKIHIPPLRERKEDIPPLCQYFVRKYAEINGKNVEGLSREAFDAVIKYHFPGNVRELENSIERAVILCRDQHIVLDDLPQSLFQPSRFAEDASQRAGLDKQVEALERRVIRAALNQAGGNQSKAARRLEITERKLRYKILKYGIHSK